MDDLDELTSWFADAGVQINTYYGMLADAGDQINTYDGMLADAGDQINEYDAGDQNNDHDMLVSAGDHINEEEGNFLERLASLPLEGNTLELQRIDQTRTTTDKQSNQRNHAWIQVSDSGDVIITGEESFFVHTDALHALSEKLHTIPDDKLDFLWRIANVNLFHGDNSRPMAREIMNIVRAVLVFVGRPDALKDVIIEFGLFRNDFSMCKCSAGNKRPLGSTMCRSCTGPRKIVHPKRSRK
jgi:hypothetical protein